MNRMTEKRIEAATRPLIETVFHGLYALPPADRKKLEARIRELNSKAAIQLLFCTYPTHPMED